jgi:hypothetical protein
MGYTTSTVHGIEVPDSSEANDIPEDIGKVVTALEGGSIIRRLTGAAIAALTAPQKPAGLVVYNTTTNKLQISDGSTFRTLDTGFSDAWKSYTPTLTASTTNPTNWAGTGYYTQVGKYVHVKGIVTAGALMTRGSGQYRVALPAPAVVSPLGNHPMEASTYMLDVSTGNATTMPVPRVADANYATWIYGSGGVGAYTFVTDTTPWTWAAGDFIQFAFFYEAA